MHKSGEVKGSQVAKLEIIQYYNTNGEVDTMEEMLEEYTSKRRTLRSPLAFFNIFWHRRLYICREHNSQLKSKDQRRTILNDLAKDLCIPLIVVL